MIINHILFPSTKLEENRFIEKSWSLFNFRKIWALFQYNSKYEISFYYGNNGQRKLTWKAFLTRAQHCIFVRIASTQRRISFVSIAINWKIKLHHLKEYWRKIVMIILVARIPHKNWFTLSKVSCWVIYVVCRLHL